jgi:hypothetical protein
VVTIEKQWLCLAEALLQKETFPAHPGAAAEFGLYRHRPREKRRATGVAVVEVYNVE